MTSMRRWWRRPGRAMLMSAAGTILLAGFAGTAAAQPDPPPDILPPAPGVTPGAVWQPGVSLPDALYTAADGSVWIQQELDTLAVPYGGQVVGAPAPVATSDAIINFGRGPDNQLWYNRVTTGFSQPSHPLGGALTSKPGAASLGGNAYAVFVRGTDGAVWERAYNGTTWAGWQRIGGQVLAGTGPAAAYLTGSKKLYVAVVGTNHQVYLKVANGSGGFFSIGGQTTVNPALTAISATTLAAFCRGTNDAGYSTRYPAAGASGWRSMGGKLSTGLSAVSGTVNGKATTYTFALGTNSAIYGNTGTWTSYPPALSGWKGY
jgi:hypothetical protein